MEEKNRFYEIDIAKGIGILLVVIGHCFPDVSTEAGISVPIFRVVHDVIYTFHMPLMFFLAGFLAQRIFRLKTGEDKLLFTKDRFIRLMIPYFAIGFLYMPVKMVMSRFAAQPFDIRNLWQIFVGENPDGGLWYLYDLFLIQVILAFICTKKNLKFLVPISAAVSALIVVTSLSFYRIDDAVYYLFFVALGLFVGLNYSDLKQYLSKSMTLITGIIFCVCIVCYLYFGIQLLKFVCGIVGAVMVFGISDIIQKQNGGGIGQCLRYLGTYTMDVYVLHGIVMVAIRIVLWSLLKLNYYVCTGAMLLGGLFIPIIISKLILRKFKILRLLFLGER